MNKPEELLQYLVDNTENDNIKWNSYYDSDMYETIYRCKFKKLSFKIVHSDDYVTLYRETFLSYKQVFGIKLSHSSKNLNMFSQLIHTINDKISMNKTERIRVEIANELKIISKLIGE